MILSIATEDDWGFYKDMVKGYQVSVAEVVVNFCIRGISMHGQDECDEPIEHLTQEDVRPQGHMNEVEEEGDEEEGDDEFSGEDTKSSVDEDDFDRFRVNNKFDDVMFENEEGDNGDISSSSDEEDCGDEAHHLEVDNNVARDVPSAEPIGHVQERSFVQLQPVWILDPHLT